MVTSTSLNFESNLKLAKAIKKLSESSNIKTVFPCVWHAEREILDKLLPGPHNEILHVHEHAGFVTAALARNKLQNNKLPPYEKDKFKSKSDEAKILICGSFNIYFVLEGLLLHRAISLPSRTPDSIQLLENLVVFDEQFPEDQFHSVNSLEDVLSMLRPWERFRVDSCTERLLMETCHRGNIGLWRPAFSLMHPDLVDEFKNAVCAVPVIKESYYMYLLNFMGFYRPDLVIILFPHAEKTFKTLKLLNWSKRWFIDLQDQTFSQNKKSQEYKQPEIFVNVTDKAFLNDIRNFMYDCFGQIYGIYSPIAGISQELALLRRMISEMG